MKKQVKDFEDPFLHQGNSQIQKGIHYLYLGCLWFFEEEVNIWH